jgi:epoxide hydrolase 4
MLSDHWADVNGIRLHYVTNGEGKLILFLHGFPEFWYEWRRQLEEFGRDHQVVAMDMRGYNLSAKPVGVEPYRVKHIVADVAGLVEQLGHERFTLVGHDWGGVVAWRFAAEYPERLERLVIVNSPHPNIFQRELAENPRQRRASQYMLLLQSPDAERILFADDLAWLRQNDLTKELWRGMSDEDVSAYLEAWSQPGALTAALSYYRAGSGPLLAVEGQASGTSRSASRPLIIRVPTLVIWGEQDKALLTGNLTGLEEFVPDLRIIRVPDGSHWLVHEQPELVNAAIREFIENSSTKSGS